MTSKQRVKNTFEYERADRVPVNYMGNPGINQRLLEHFKTTDFEDVFSALGVDFRGAFASYSGPALFKPLPNRRVDPVYGFYTRYVEHQTGGYWDFCDFPLIDADDEAIANFPVPNPDHFDYTPVDEVIARHKDKAIYISGAGTADIINSTGRVMGMEETLVRLHTEDEATLRYISRRCDMEIAVLERTLEKHKGAVDFLWMGEDLGTQHSPLISLDLYRDVLYPFHKRYFELAKAYSLPVMVHTCGSSSWVYEDFIAAGVKAVDTLQPEAANMSPRYLKDTFGGRLAFHGCISTAGPLAYGTVEEVEKVCRETLEIMMPGGGYFFSPTHLIQDNTPTENVIAMYNTVKKYGAY